MKKEQRPLHKWQGAKKDETTGKYALVFSSGNKNNLCQVRYCRNLRDKKNRRRVCCSCNYRIKSLNNPRTYAYHQLKKSAKKRNIPFGLSHNEFKDFCDRTGYLELKGKHSKNYCVDRIDDNKGYIPGNIQMITQYENITKENRRRAKKELEENCPF